MKNILKRINDPGWIYLHYDTDLLRRALLSRSLESGLSRYCSYFKVCTSCSKYRPKWKQILTKVCKLNNVQILCTMQIAQVYTQALSMCSGHA